MHVLCIINGERERERESKPYYTHVCQAIINSIEDANEKYNASKIIVKFKILTEEYFQLMVVGPGTTRMGDLCFYGEPIKISRPPHSPSVFRSGQDYHSIVQLTTNIDFI